MSTHTSMKHGNDLKKTHSIYNHISHVHPLLQFIVRFNCSPMSFSKQNDLKVELCFDISQHMKKEGGADSQVCKSRTLINNSLFTNLWQSVFTERDDISPILVIKVGLIPHVTHVLIQLTQNISDLQRIASRIWHICIDLCPNVYSKSLLSIKTSYVIVCIVGSSKALSNPASTGLDLLFFLSVSLVNCWTDRCFLILAHMKMHTRRSKADLRSHIGMLHYSEAFSNRAFEK